MEKIYRAAKYIRTSCPDNETQYSDSVANQRRLINAFIQAHTEIIAVSEKTDEGYSGLSLNRPAFKELLADVEAGAINCIIVKDAYVKYRLKFYEDYLWGFTTRIVFVFNTYIARHFFQYENRAILM